MTTNAYDTILQPLIAKVTERHSTIESFLTHLDNLLTRHERNALENDQGFLGAVTRLASGIAAAPAPVSLDGAEINPVTKQPYPPGHDMPNIARRGNGQQATH